MKTVWFYNGTKMSDGSLKSVGAIDEAQVAECEKKGWVRVDDYDGEFGEIGNKIETPNTSGINFLTVTTDDTTKKLLITKAKELGLKIDGRSKEQDILDAIQETLKVNG